jgi:hypothetical protein
LCEKSGRNSYKGEKIINNEELRIKNEEWGMAFVNIQSLVEILLNIVNHE